MMLDNRKKLKDSKTIYKYNYPEVNLNTIPQEVYESVLERNKKSIQFKDEPRLFLGKQESLYDITNFEIYFSNKKPITNKSSPDRYIYIDRINSEKMNYYIQGVITGPPGSKFLNQLVSAEISEYSLQYGAKEEWSLWIQVTCDSWFRLNQPFSAYGKFFSPMFYRFKVIMNTSEFFEKKVKNKSTNKYNLEVLENYIHRNYDDYQIGDILGFKDEVLKHVGEFLNINIRAHEVISKINREMDLAIMQKKNSATTKNIEIIKFIPPQTYVNVFIDRIQTEIGKELKKTRIDTIGCFKKRFLERMQNTLTNDDRDNGEGEENEDEDYDEDYDYGDCGGGDGIGDSVIFKSNDHKNSREDSNSGTDDNQKCISNYDFNYNYDDELHQKEAILSEKRERDTGVVNADLNDVLSHDYLLKDDILCFKNLPLETIVYKAYGSLFTLPGLDINLETSDNFDFDTNNEFTDDVLPFLICRVCGHARQIVGATCDPSQNINEEMCESIVDYIIHLEKHRMEILRSISKKSRDRLDKSLVFNSFLTRSKVEKLESNSLKQSLRKRKSILFLKKRLELLKIKIKIKNENENNNNNQNNNQNTTKNNPVFNSWP
ncbi:hypothetical protein ACTFIY_012336 [Dictyostelium cf. discoideum]